MATFSEIKEVRLTISDPAGFIDFLEVANFAALPGSQVAQTGYKAVDTGTYYDKSSGAWLAETIMVSDADLSAWIDTFGIPGAIRKAIERILATLPAQMQIVRNADGAESTEFLKLLDLQKFYRQWLADLTPTDQTVVTSRFGSARSPVIAGGDV